MVDGLGVLGRGGREKYNNLPHVPLGDIFELSGDQTDRMPGPIVA